MREVMLIKSNRLKSLENFHILLWLLKDNSWLHEWIWLGCVAIVPTISVQVFIAWKNRGDVEEFVHNAAIVFWLIANSIWMVGEFFFNDGTRSIAAWFFDIGLALIGLYYVRAIGLRFRHKTG